MRILFCSQTHLSKELGASKVIMELSEEMGKLGWTCEMLAPADLLSQQNRNGNKPYHQYLRECLRKIAGEYHVVEYDHHHLPYSRQEFPTETLFVARSVLLGHHFNKIAIPCDPSFKSKLHHLLKRRSEAKQRQQEKHLPYITVNEADLVNVANYDDQTELIGCGIQREKVAVIPYGIDQQRRALFNAVSSAPPPEPKVAFVGTFDTRKGATDFPAIVENVCAVIPNVSFRLMGTYKDEAAVLGAFSKRLRQRVEVVPRYDADELPDWLAACSVGIFPSYIEGFGFGVLEMLAASIPVIAYNSPGPPMMLPPAYLVSRGDTNAMSQKVIELLQDRDKLIQARDWAKHRSQEFCWQRIAQQTSDIYAERWQRKQSKVAAQRMSQL